MKADAGTLQTSSRFFRSSKVLIGLPVLLAVVAVGAGVVFWANSAAGSAAASYETQYRKLTSAIAAARQQGFTPGELAPVVDQLASVSAKGQPWFVPGRPAYYTALASRSAQLQNELAALEQRILAQERSQAEKEISAANAEIGMDQQAGADTPDVQSLQQQLSAATQLDQRAATLAQYRSALSQARAVDTAATSLYTLTQQQNQQIQQAATQLMAQTGNNLSAIQNAGNQAVFNGDNDASVAAYLNRPSNFSGYEPIMRAYSRLQHFQPMIGSSDVSQAALGAAGVQFYANQIQQELISNLPPKIIIVSFQAQHLWAYQSGQVVMQTPVTTGIRGVGSEGTDFGAMHVWSKYHPFKFISPWPPGNPLYYPPTTVQYATFFTPQANGEAIHDASWEPDSDLGPGSQYTAGLQSHGCIHVPLSVAAWVYNWAPLGMPVVVYPGDGSSVANQLSQVTTNAQGVPQSAP
jgi:lipoprotein-anchoring transpeptidase ErfK/SrfK